MTFAHPQRWCFAAAASMLMIGCASDGPDGYSAPIEAAPTTARSLPTTMAPPPTTESPDTEMSDGVATSAPTTTVAPVAPNGDVVRVRSLDNSYRVADIEVVAGTEVWWTNNGRNDHNVLPVDDTQTWGVDTEDFTPGDEYRYVFDTPGTYLYYCSIHGTKTVGMVGSVEVLPA